MARTPEYEVWKTMHQRCENPRSQKYKDYGGRGIRVCARWSGPNGYANFIADMGPRPEGSTGKIAYYSIDRWPDPDGHYEPGNTRWATPAQQQAGKRRHGTTKLTPEQVRAVRADTRPQVAIAAAYEVSTALVSLIKNGKRWPDIK